MTQLFAQPAAGWYADPSGQHEARYWDGTRWTDRVADRGVENRGSDPTPLETPAGPVAGDPPVATGAGPAQGPFDPLVDRTIEGPVTTGPEPSAESAVFEM